MVLQSLYDSCTVTAIKSHGVNVAQPLKKKSFFSCLTSQDMSVEFDGSSLHRSVL